VAFKFTVGTLTSIFKDRISLRNNKTAEIMVYLNFFACGWKDPDPDPRGPKHTEGEGNFKSDI
jgi:hypothetical protein